MNKHVGGGWGYIYWRPSLQETSKKEEDPLDVLCREASRGKKEKKEPASLGERGRPNTRQNGFCLQADGSGDRFGSDS